VLASVVRDGVRMSALGIAIGFLLSVAIGQLLGRVLYGVTPTDPVTYASVFAVLTIVSLLACYLPARRASRINPMVALRNE
jgi:ABC-type antimicrobial peptide transport system permease subunit